MGASLERGNESIQVGNDQEMAQSDLPTPKTEGWEKPYTKKTYRRPSEHILLNRRPLIYPNLTKINGYGHMTKTVTMAINSKYKIVNINTSKHI